MFEIEIVVEPCRMTGLDALDWRRSHDMFDGTAVTIDRYRKRYPVDEAFARKWFTRSETLASATVGVDDLLACDMAPHDNYPWIVRIAISPERAEALFVASRTKKPLFDDVVDLRITPFTPGKVTGPPPGDDYLHLNGDPRRQPGSISSVDAALERGGRP